MDDLKMELAGMRLRHRLQILVMAGILVIQLFAHGGAEVVARALVESDAWTIRTKNVAGTLTPRLVITTDVDSARVKIQNANLELAPQATAQLPSIAAAGALAYDSTTGTLKYRNSTQWIDASGGSPPGTVLTWTTATAPLGYLICSGQSVSRTTYAGLFAVIGTTFGTGDGSTTFTLPDLRGRVVICKDDLGGVAAGRVTASQAISIGQGAGEETHILTANEMPAHSHSLNVPQVFGANLPNVIPWNTAKGTTSSTGSAGGGLAHNNMQPYLTLAFIIKY